MATMDVFGDNAFGVIALTAAIQNVIYTPRYLEQSGLFSNTSGISTLDAFIDWRQNALQLLDVSPRGGTEKPIPESGRTARSYRITHLQQNDFVTADEVLGVRAFGSESQMETVGQLVAEKLRIMGESIRYTQEAHRLNSVKGNMWTANGQNISLFTEFGLTQQTLNMALATEATLMRAKCLEIIEKQETALDGRSGEITESVAYCGAQFFKDLVEQKSIRETYLNTMQASSLRGNPSMEFSFGGIRWVRYRGTASVGIHTDEAYVVPSGVSNMFLTRYGPADFIEAAGTRGQMMYARQHMRADGKGVNLEAQSNPLILNTQPDAVIRLHRAAGL